MKILIIGKGGREHAIAWKVKQSSLVKEIFIAPGSDGMKNLGTIVDINENDVVKLADFAKINNIDLTIVGPESSLAQGVVNEFEKRGLKIFGPTKEATQIESSKEFAKKLMKKYNIPTAKYEVFDNFISAMDYIEKKGVPIVIKEDGLKAGKGVTVAFTKEEAYTAVQSAFNVENNRIVIEEYLSGFEFSIIALVNKDIIIPLEIAQDHKRVFDDDKGENTGGMGAYSPVDRVTQDIVDETVKQILRPTIEAMRLEGIEFKGFLFAGIMITENGVKTIEFNARFGDPEAQVILPRLKDDFVQLIFDIMNGKERKLNWDTRYCLGVVMASKNYPKSSTIGSEIVMPKNLNSIIFHMGTKLEKDKWKTAGGRVLCVVGLEDAPNELKKNVYDDVKKIECEDLFFRNDIGKML